MATGALRPPGQKHKGTPRGSRNAWIRGPRMTPCPHDSTTPLAGGPACEIDFHPPGPHAMGIPTLFESDGTPQWMTARGVGFIGGACVDRPTEIPRVMSRARAVCLGPVGRAIEGRARRMRILRCQESTSARPLLISSRVSEQSRGIRVFNKQDSRAFRPAAGHSRLIYPILPPPQPTFSRATSPLHVLVTLISSESAHSEAAPEFKKARDRGSPSFRPG